MANTKKNTSKSGTFASTKAIDNLQKQAPVQWSLDPDTVVRATRDALTQAKGALSVEKLLGILEKQYNISMPGEGTTSKRATLNSILRLVDEKDLMVKRRLGVDLPEHADHDFRLREALRGQGLSTAIIDQVVKESGLGRAAA